MAEENGTVRGILPLFVQKSWLLGKWVCSMPLVQGGGVAAENLEASQQLLQKACALTVEVGGKYLELRGCSAQTCGLKRRDDKVKAVLSLNDDPQKMLQAFDSRVRTSIRKAQKAGLSCHFGGAELLADFYVVFSENMRDLGTPVYERRFFEDVLQAFSRECFLCVVRFEGKPIACDLLVGFRQTIESAWAASIRKYLSLKPNMFLHWNAFCFAADRGYSVFDFGRSTAGSGTHRYKMQWGSQEIPLNWSYWCPGEQKVQTLDRHNPKLRFAIGAWRKLPLSIANRVGPVLVKHLPS